MCKNDTTLSTEITRDNEDGELKTAIGRRRRSRDKVAGTLLRENFLHNSIYAYMKTNDRRHIRRIKFSLLYNCTLQQPVQSRLFKELV